MGLGVINFFSNVLDTCLVFYFLIVVLNKKDINIKKTILLMLGLISFNTLVNLGLGLANFIGFLIILTISTIGYSLLLKEPFGRIIIYSISSTVLMGVIEIVSVAIISLVFNVPTSILLEANIYRIFGILLSKLIMLLSTKYLVRKIKIPRFLDIKFSKSILVILLFNMFIIFMTYTVYKHLKNQTMEEYLYLVGIGLGTIVFSWLIFKITKESIYRSQQEVIWKLKEEEIYKKNFYINNVKEILQTIRAQRHELNNYLSILYGLICLEDFDKVKEYISKINDRLSGMNSIIETNNPIITAIISIQKNKAFNEGIEMDLDIDELPEELPFDSLDLSIIIGNLLNNAMEACLSLGKDQVRKIQFYMWIEKEKLTIHIKNTKSNLRKLDVKEILGRFTTKEDKEKHGFGLSNVDFIVNQYNGILNLEDLGDEFVVDVTLPMNRDLKNDVKATT